LDKLTGRLAPFPRAKAEAVDPAEATAKPDDTSQAMSVARTLDDNAEYLASTSGFRHIGSSPFSQPDAERLCFVPHFTALLPNAACLTAHLKDLM
jgi:hypothetical protein